MVGLLLALRVLPQGVQSLGSRRSIVRLFIRNKKIKIRKSTMAWIPLKKPHTRFRRRKCAVCQLIVACARA